MKKIVILLFLAFGNFQRVNAQTTSPSCLAELPEMKPFDFNPPIFIDSALFVNDLKSVVDLKSVYNQLKKDTVFASYLYTFSINKQGKIEPGNYYNKNDLLFKKMHNYVVDVFNRFKWEPGYRKKCKSCKGSLFMELEIFFNTRKSNVEVFIRHIELPQNIETVFYLDLPYKSLKYK